MKRIKKKFKTFEEVKKALEEGKTLKYVCSDGEFDVLYKKDSRKILVDSFDCCEDVEEANQLLIDGHNEDVALYSQNEEEIWDSWRDIADEEFHYVPWEFKEIK